jgi:hypothetical protein
MSVTVRVPAAQMAKLRAARKRRGAGLPVKVHLDDGHSKCDCIAAPAGGSIASTFKSVGKSIAKAALPAAVRLAEKAATKALTGAGAKKGRKKGKRRKGGLVHVGAGMSQVRGL